jgi:4-hydroxybutyrate CoA-transferase
MIDYKTEYKSKIVSFEQAAKHIRSGDFVATNLALGGWSKEMVHAILARAPELEHVTLSDALQMDPTIKLYDEKFLRQAQGKIHYLPAFSSSFTRHLFEKNLADPYLAQGTDCGFKMGNVCDVWIVPVTPPNRHGFVNLGLTNMWTMDTVRVGRETGKLRLLIGEVNDQMPVVYGDNWLQVSDFSLFVEHSQPIPYFSRSTPGEKEKAIAKHILSLIDDGSTFQMGIGTIPEAVVSHLDVKNDLGVFTEMFPTGLPELIKKGVVTNKRKPIHKGVNIATFCLGDQTMYDFVTENPGCLFYPGSYCDDSNIIAQHPNFVAINMAVLVDLSGQICSEGIGHRQISATGGQLDFQIGGYRSKGGKAITVLTSARTLKDGKYASSILADLPPGTPISVPRHYADYIVTEYGVAHLKYKARQQRAEALIEIAHPDFRDELKDAMKKNFCPSNMG